MTLKEVLIKENVGKHFIFIEKTLEKHYCHQIIQNSENICYISNRGTIINPEGLQRLDLEVLLVEF